MNDKIQKAKMKKFVMYLIAIFLVIISLNGCSSSSESTEDSRYDTPPKKIIENIEANHRDYIKSSNIKTIEKIQFGLNEDNEPVSSEKLSAEKYNNNGFLDETIIYNPDGGIEYKYVYEYDKDNLRTKTIRYNSKGISDKYYTYEYNKYGNKVKSSRFDTGGELEKYYLYEYDDEGKLISEKWFDKSNKLEYEIDYEYENGRKTWVKTYNSDGDLAAKYEIKYDTNGNIVEEIRSNSYGDEIGLLQYVYKYY